MQHVLEVLGNDTSFLNMFLFVGESSNIERYCVAMFLCEFSENVEVFIGVRSWPW